ncbi:MAG: type III PLP-dependent enzyme [Dichotomicrobium sp.]
MEQFSCAADLLRSRTPDVPVLCVRPHAAVRATRWFRDNFPGRTLYAVKANDAADILEALHGAGLRDFDAASLDEIARIHTLPGAQAHVMNPVKSRALIRSAYFDYGVRTFAFDSAEELDKIIAETGGARDLTLMLRLICPNTHSEIPLEGKYGVALAQAADLLTHARGVAGRLGLTFHVGSQAMSPEGFGEALHTTARYIATSPARIDMVDVGGGFPACYPGLEPPPLGDFVTAITEAFDRLWVGEECELWAEPGRALVAEAESVLVRVDARRGRMLYINDGAFGTLFDAAHANFTFPARGLRAGTGVIEDAPASGFALFGPTCDSFDHLPGPFMLPANIAEGDYIEIGNVGAYGRVMASPFNGFGKYERVIVTDEPMMSMYAPTAPDMQADRASALG